MLLNNTYDENYVIKKFGHIKNMPLKAISSSDLKKLIFKLSHDILLVNAMKKVLKDRNSINIEAELAKLDEIKSFNTPIPSGFKLNNIRIDYALKNNITKEDTPLLFENFFNYYNEKQYKSKDWNKLWEDWVDKNKGFKPTPSEKKNPFEFETPINGEKHPYMINNIKEFNKINAISDKIKDMLKFELNIDWLDNHYWKDIPIDGIKWQKCYHPYKNSDIIILYFDDENQTVANFKTNLHTLPTPALPTANNNDEIIDIEIEDVVENEIFKTPEEFDILLSKSNKLKDWLKATHNKDWYKDYYLKNQTPNPDYHFVVTQNPHNDQEEILILKK